MIPPIATYRLQFREGMTFDRAEQIVPYLARLGISHLYASPVFTATSGSTHGYDITDYNEIDPALGGLDGFARLSRALRDAGIGIMLDIVPNHMAASPENHWWRDVAEWGAQARHARHFDIDWSRRLTLPVLGEDFDDVLAAGEIAVSADAQGRGIVLAYHDHAYPLTPPSYALLAGADPANHLLSELAATAARASPAHALAFHHEMRTLLARPDAAAALGDDLARASQDHALVARLHAAQPWQFTNWRQGRHDLSYRRFFEVTGLVGTRVEDAAVFEDVHRLTLDLLHDGLIDGLRVDHVDGLTDPHAYLTRLRAAAGQDTWVVVEKILDADEDLPADWPVEGTTGYEFIASMSDLLLPASGAAALERAYASVAETPPIAQRRHVAKQRIVTHNFEGELTRLCGLLAPLVPDVPPDTLREALVALIVALPVYRTYGDAQGFSPQDRALLDDCAQRAAESTDHRAVTALVEALSMPQGREARARFQQLSGPAMAKAVEDTLFYRHNAMIAFNEVGCDPVHPPARTADVHDALAARQHLQPFGLNATSTHDTKRGEDARTRLYALAEAPDLWTAAVIRWRGWAERRVEDGAPEPATEWAMYQALAGAWPDADDLPDAATLDGLRERFVEYLVKAMREAKLRTNWTDTDPEYEDAVCAYATALLSPRNARFVTDFHATLLPFIRAGRIGSLSQTLIKLTAPGVPDIYQGSEGGDFSLVDPDNRRPVDWDRLVQLLDMAGQVPPAPEAAKPLVIQRALAARAAQPDLFAKGDYLPLAVSGPRAEMVFAFMRRHGSAVAVTAVPIRPLALQRGNGADGFWNGTTIALPVNASPLRSVLTGQGFVTRDLPVSALFDALPVALLAKADD